MPKLRLAPLVQRSRAFVFFFLLYVSLIFYFFNTFFLDICFMEILLESRAPPLRLPLFAALSLSAMPRGLPWFFSFFNILPLIFLALTLWGWVFEKKRERQGSNPKKREWQGSIFRVSILLCKRIDKVLFVSQNISVTITESDKQL